tara:strand:- start:103 stop:1029 length:927 start_codon:yes stop_codon:yes gene_type:complete
MAYIGVSPSNGVRRVHTYTVSGSSTDTFSGAGAEGTTLSYKDSNFVDVYQNGVKLADADYTATSGTSIVLGTTASDGDIVVIVTFDVFSVADTVSKADGGTFDGNVTMGGTLGVTGVPTFTGRSVHNGGITVANSGQIGSVGDTDAMTISSGGVVNFTQIPTGTPTGTAFSLVSTSSNTGQSISNGVETVLTFDSAPVDTASITSTSSNNVTITAATAGTYLIHCCSRLDQRPGRHELYLFVNSSIKLISAKGSNDAGSGAEPTIELTGILALADGDVLQLRHWQFSGGTRATVANYNCPSLNGVRLF